MKQKPSLRFPGSTYLIDGPYINVGSIIAIWLLVFFSAPAITLLLSWHQVTIASHVFFPLPTNEQPAAFHVLAFYKVWAGIFFPSLQGEDFKRYIQFYYWLDRRGEVDRLQSRWLLSIMVALISSTWLALKSWKPVQTEIQVRGPVLVKKIDAYTSLKADWANQNKRGSDFIFESDVGFDPTDPLTGEKLKPHELVMMPTSQRSAHFMFVAGSRRGKTQRIMKIIYQLYQRAIAGEAVKLLIIDTQKSDYSRYVHPEHRHLIAPPDEDGLKWAMPKDLNTKQAAEEFWLGKIPNSDKDPFWNNASRGIGVAATVTLINTCGEDWSCNNLVRYLKFSSDELEPHIRKHYPESLQIIQMGEQTLSSVMGTNEAYTKDLVQLAEIWDGYQYKHDIAQMSVRLLQDKYAENQSEFCLELLPLYDYQAKSVGGNYPPIIRNIIPHLLLKGLVRSLNKKAKVRQDHWTWGELKQALSQPYSDIVQCAAKGMTSDEAALFCPDTSQHAVLAFIETMANSARSVLDEKDLLALVDRIITTDKQANFIVRALLRKCGFSGSPWSKMVKYGDAWKAGNHRIIFDILVQHLTSYELSSYQNKNDHSTLLEACKPIFEWHHVWDEYEAKPSISFREWICDENPEKKVFIIKNSGQFNSLTSPLIRGMLYFAKGIIGDDSFLDAADAGITRQFYVLMDELQSIGDISEFIESGMEMFASKQVTLMVAFQDLAQLVKIYSKEFVDFLMSNTANIFFIGSNSGESAELISKFIGKKWFKKLHTSITYQDNGKSMSQNWQEHEGMVMTPDEVNSELGLDINGMPRKTFLQWMFRMKADSLPIRYIYKGSNMSKTYLLETPVCSYPVVTKPIPAKWRDAKNKPRPNPFNAGSLIAKTTAAAQQDKDRPHTLNRWVTEQPEDIPDDSWTLEAPQVAYEPSEEDLEGLYDVTDQVERQHIYKLPTESDELEGAVNVAVEHVSPALGMATHAAEALLTMKSATTTNRDKFRAEVERLRLEKKRDRNE